MLDTLYQWMAQLEQLTGMATETYSKLHDIDQIAASLGSHFYKLLAKSLERV